MGQVHVKEEYELYQIITDFGDPLEIFREGIQNSFDEGASEIYVNVYEKQKLGGDSSLIIEIIDNGRGLPQKNIANFFDVANSTKVNNDFIPNSKNKHGYKGHGAKVFFNANEVIICSKTKQGEYWAAQLKNPIEQIADRISGEDRNKLLQLCDWKGIKLYEIEVDSESYQLRRKQVN